MHVTQPERPPLATVVCIYEVFTVVLAIASHYIVHHRHHALALGQPSTHVPVTNPLDPAASVISYALAAAAAVALWRMHRSAFLFLAGRFCISLAVFIAALLHLKLLLATMHQHPLPVSPSAIAGAVSLVAILGIALDACIAWYAYDITSPPALYPPDPDA